MPHMRVRCLVLAKSNPKHAQSKDTPCTETRASHFCKLFIGETGQVSAK